jgi:tRNA (mo5U34)-methyltransferase
MSKQNVLDDITRLGPWFHNIHLSDAVQTFPNHHFGDFPDWKWQQLAPHLPADLSGWKVLDIGCNAGFYSFELARRGAQVRGIDANPHFITQARWAATQLGLSDVCRFELRQVYDLARMNERWDLVLFMGVFYHLRYPLLGLDIVAEKVDRYLVFQSAATGKAGPSDIPADVDFQTMGELERPSWPCMAFIENTFCHDATNWWIPNCQAMVGMLRSTGMKIETVVDADTFVCSPGGSHGARSWNRAEYLAAAGTVEPVARGGATDTAKQMHSSVPKANGRKRIDGYADFIRKLFRIAAVVRLLGAILKKLGLAPGRYVGPEPVAREAFGGYNIGRPPVTGINAEVM